MFRPVQAVAGRIFAWSARIWLVLEAWLTMRQTLDIPFGIREIIQLLGIDIGRWQLVGALVLYIWPGVVTICLTFFSQEASRWLKRRRQRRVADRLATAWFTFLATLWLVSVFSPTIELELSPGAIEASAALILCYLTSWFSRLTHVATRRKWRMRLRRWHGRKLLTAMLEALVKKLSRFSKGLNGHATRVRIHGQAR